MTALLAIGGAYALASWDWCGRWLREPAKLISSARATGELRAGAATIDLEPPFPVTVAGYGPMRPTATRAIRPAKARAVILQVGEVKAAVVALDVLLIPDAVVKEVRTRSGLADAWVVATHTHSSMGGYDERPLAELAGTGMFRAAAKNALVRAAVEALSKASAALAPARLALGQAEPSLCRARTGVDCDRRLTRMKLSSETGPIAEWLVLAAHPALVPRASDVVDPDYPGALAERRWTADAGVTLVLQGAGGNASVAEAQTPAAFAEQIEQQLPPLAPVEGPIELAVARARVTLPHPDASRLVPTFSRVAASNFVCLSATREAEVAVIRLGNMSWLSAPIEASQPSGARLEAAAGAGRLISLANGYLGYVEPVDVVALGGAESKKQYYGAELLEVLEEASKIAGDAAR
jgi:neutral ceramidase